MGRVMWRRWSNLGVLTGREYILNGVFLFCGVGLVRGNGLGELKGVGWIGYKVVVFGLVVMG